MMKEKSTDCYIVLPLSNDLANSYTKLAIESGEDIRDYATKALVDYAPLSVIKRRDPESYHQIMVAIFQLATNSAWQPGKLASEEQTALLHTELNNKSMRDYYKQKTAKILDEIKSVRLNGDQQENS